MDLMELSNQLDRAIAIAVKAHSGQRDKAGTVYIVHVMRVMLACNDPISMQAAVLHDVVEDTTITLEDLICSGIHPEAVEAVKLLTRENQDSGSVQYADYVIRISANPIAKAVKLLDLQDNYRLDRVALRPENYEEDLSRVQKYILSYHYLSDRMGVDEYRRQMTKLAD